MLSPADPAKALALGADAVAIGTAALIAIGGDRPSSPPITRSSPPTWTRSRPVAASRTACV
ncbi:glutamate synthase-related protein [Streptomyces sp. NPDC002092]